jgi:hypothetical protein
MEKKDALRELDSNLTIIDKKLNVYNAAVVQKIINGLISAKAENPSFEPRKYGSTKGKNTVLDSVLLCSRGRTPSEPMIGRKASQILMFL